MDHEKYRQEISVASIALKYAKSNDHYKRGDVIFNSSDTPNGLFFVNRGLIRLESNSMDGETCLFRFIRHEEVLGFRAMISNEPYHVSAVVHEDSHVYFIPKDCVFKIMSEFPEFLLKMTLELSVELRKADMRIESIIHKDAGTRIVEALLYFKERYPNHIWTRKEIAEWAGTTPETVIRLLAKIENEGAIEQSGRMIKILNRKKLLELGQRTERQELIA